MSNQKDTIEEIVKLVFDRLEETTDCFVDTEFEKELREKLTSLKSEVDKEWREKIEESFYEIEELEKDFELNQKIIKIRNQLLQ